MLFLPGFGGGLTPGLTVGQDPEDALHETFAETVTAVVGVGLGEFVTVAGEEEEASLPGVVMLVPPDVGLALGAVVTAEGPELLGAGVVLEALTGFATGFSMGDVTTVA